MTTHASNPKQDRFVTEDNTYVYPATQPFDGFVEWDFPEQDNAPGTLRLSPMCEATEEDILAALDILDA